MRGLARLRGAARRLLQPRTVVPRLVVPDRLNRNSARVNALMAPQDAGVALLERMRERIGIASYAGVRVLDFGCGVRFSQAILNTGLDIGRYTGVDNSRDVIEFLTAHVQDPRFSYHFLDAHHALYNPAGSPLSAATRLPVDDASLDIACLFSVITHQHPEASRAIFALLRRYLRADGHLFFTCFLDDAVDTFEDRSPEGNGGYCVYNPAFLGDLVAACGWRLGSTAPPDGPLIASSFVYQPL
jgi:SAM-dependent methyltransferase